MFPFRVRPITPSGWQQRELGFNANGVLHYQERVALEQVQVQRAQVERAVRAAEAARGINARRRGCRAAVALLEDLRRLSTLGVAAGDPALPFARTDHPDVQVFLVGQYGSLVDLQAARDQCDTMWALYRRSPRLNAAGATQAFPFLRDRLTMIVTTWNELADWSSPAGRQAVTHQYLRRLHDVCGTPSNWLRGVQSLPCAVRHRLVFERL